MKTNRIFLWVLISFSFSCASEKERLQYKVVKSYFKNIEKGNYEDIFLNSVWDSTAKIPFHNFLTFEEAIYGKFQGFEVIENSKADEMEEEFIIRNSNDKKIYMRYICGGHGFNAGGFKVLCKVRYEKSEHFTLFGFLKNRDDGQYKLACVESFSSKEQISNAVFSQGEDFIRYVSEKKYDEIYQQIFSSDFKNIYKLTDSTFHAQGDTIFQYFPTNNSKIKPHIHRTNIKIRLLQDTVLLLPTLSLYYKIANQDKYDYMKTDFIFENGKAYFFICEVFCKSCL